MKQNTQEKKKVFDLEDIKPQLNEQQIKELEHIIYMAKNMREDNMQEVTIGNRKIIVFHSGKMMFKSERKKYKVLNEETLSQKIQELKEKYPRDYKKILKTLKIEEVLS